MGLAYLAWAGVKAFLPPAVADFEDAISPTGGWRFSGCHFISRTDGANFISATELGIIVRQRAAI